MCSRFGTVCFILAVLSLAPIPAVKAQTRPNVQELIAKLKSSDPPTRRAAQIALMQLDASATPSLAAALKDSDAAIRRDAAEALGEIGPDAKAAVPMLSVALQDKSDDVREAAADALGDIGPDATPAIPALISALQDRDSSVKVLASNALVAIGQKAVPALIEKLAVDDYNLREAASDVLQKLGSAAVPDLVPALQDTRFNVRDRASSVLQRIGSDALPGLFSALNSPDSTTRLVIIDNLGHFGSSGSVIAQVLVGRLTDPISTVRSAAIQSLRTLSYGLDADTKTKTAFDIVRMLQDPAPSVRAAAAEALSDFGPAAPTTVKALEFAAKDTDGTVRGSAFQSLSLVAPKTPGLITLLIQGLKDGDNGARTGAAAGLKTIGSAALPALRVAAKDPNPAVRVSAIEVLREIGRNDSSNTVADSVVAASVDSMIYSAAHPEPDIHSVPDNDVSLPNFPLPPPQPTLILPLTRARIGKDSDTLDSVCGHLRAILSAAGYSDQSLMAAPGGFAVITRIEQINQDGSCVPDPNRFGTAPPPISGSFLSWMKEYCHRLFCPNDQQFRMFVALVTPYDVQGSGQSLDFTEAHKWLQSGGQILPRSIGRKTFKGENCFVLVYDYAYVQSENSPDLILSPLSAMTHCKKAGILTAMGGQP